jgi:uncharacterized membrane protein YfcA
VPAWLELTVLAAAGVIAGALNVVAGGGSFLILPLLLFFGMPAAIANGTNRVGVLTQNFGGVAGFHRHGAVDWSWARTASIPALVGASIGVWLALSIPDFAFRRMLSVAMVCVTVWSLLGPQRDGRRALLPPTHPLVVVGFFVVGLYGGFIQAGVGFLVLAITTSAGMDLVRGNAVKLLTILLLTALSLGAFAASHQVDWPRGAALGVGNLIGSQFGVRLAVMKGHDWLQRLVTIVVIVFAIGLWLQ